TGLTAHPRFRVLVIRELSRITGLRLRPAPSTVPATWSLRPLVACSGALRGLAVDLGRICFDLRLLASRPRAALGRLILPEAAPGAGRPGPGGRPCSRAATPRPRRSRPTSATP